MHVREIVTQFLSKVIHKTRLESLIPVITGLITSKQLKLTQLGRSLNVEATERSGIRRIDRLLANPYYQEHSIEIYKAITQRVLGNQGRPIILVDWTSLPNSHQMTEEGEHCALRASLIAEGRSITLYEEVHPKKKEGNDNVHQAFLKKLASILPVGCCPYIVTDAGFRNPWFKAVSPLGWDYVGRVRGVVNYFYNNQWESVKKLFEQVKSFSPRFIGEILLSSKSPLKTYLYSYRHKLKGRTKLNSKGEKDKRKNSQTHSRSYKEPWLLVSSLSGLTAAKRVVKLYQWRMTIEGSFRDTKSVEYGFSMNENRTIKAKRYAVWLMLASLASLVAWLVGYAAEQKKLHHDFQANSYRHRRVLSFFYLGCQVIRKKIDMLIQWEEIVLNALDDAAWTTLC
jgi:hypothetical protein